MLVTPFPYATDLLRVLDELIRAQKCIELTTKCLLFLLRSVIILAVYVSYAGKAL